MRSAAAEIYADQLSSKGYGYPLWYPEPHPNTVDDEVFIGHVGHISDGGFHPLFNVTLPSGHRANQKGVPRGFTELEFDRGALLWTTEQALRPGALCSQTVKSLDATIEAGTGVCAVSIDAQTQLSFGCASKQGALLVLKEGGADQQRLLANHLFPRYMIEHHDSWCNFAREKGLDVAPERIILVQGTMKAANWTLAAFSDHSNDVSLSLKARIGSVLSAGASVHKSVAIQMTPEKRDSEKGAGGMYNQRRVKNHCVFLSRYEIRRRSWLRGWSQEPEVVGYRRDEDYVPGCLCAWPWCRRHRISEPPPISKPRRAPKSNGVEGGGYPPPDDGGGHSGPGNEHGHGTSVNTSARVGRGRIWDPLHALLAYILMQSDCDTAIASDEDVRKLSTVGYDLTRDQFEKQLYSFKPHISVSEGVGIVALPDHNRTTVGHSASITVLSSHTTQHGRAWSNIAREDVPPEHEIKPEAREVDVSTAYYGSKVPSFMSDRIMEQQSIDPAGRAETLSAMDCLPIADDPTVIQSTLPPPGQKLTIQIPDAEIGSKASPDEATINDPPASAPDVVRPPAWRSVISRRSRRDPERGGISVTDPELQTKGISTAPGDARTQRRLAEWPEHFTPSTPSPSAKLDKPLPTPPPPPPLGKESPSLGIFDPL